MYSMNRTISQADFTIERDFNASREALFMAFSDPAKKDLWFKDPHWEQTVDRQIDFRVGKTEVRIGKSADGLRHTFKALYYDIVPLERIVYTYEMYFDENRISVSLATVQFAEHREKTRLLIHEHGTFLDGYDTVLVREQATRGLLENLARSLVC